VLRVTSGEWWEKRVIISLFEKRYTMKWALLLLGCIAAKKYSVSYWIEGESNEISKFQRIGSIASESWKWDAVPVDSNKPHDVALGVEDINSLFRVSIGDSIQASIPVQAIKVECGLDFRLTLK
jgi:hypothetical protein